MLHAKDSIQLSPEDKMPNTSGHIVAYILYRINGFSDFIHHPNSKIRR
jgi:hypothetical protein